MEITEDQRERWATVYAAYLAENVAVIEDLFQRKGTKGLALARVQLGEHEYAKAFDAWEDAPGEPVTEETTGQAFDRAVRSLQVATALGCEPGTQAVLGDRADDALMAWLAAREASRQIFRVRACEGGYDVVDTRTGDQVVEPVASMATAAEYASMFEAILSAYVTGGAR